ncbi:MAG: hypothetical protein AAGC55_30590, partial [Myxococcota bacterium]
HVGQPIPVAILRDLAGQYKQVGSAHGGDDLRLVRFADPLPARVATRYDQRAVRQLIHLAGAERDLDAAALRRYLPEVSADGVAPATAGLDSALARARYVAELAAEQPALRDALELQRRPWLPTRTGALAAPERLYWPDGDAAAVVGERAELYPHPEFFHTAPDGIASWLRFRAVADAALGDVINHMDECLGRGEEVPDEVWEWLDSGLRDGRLDAGAVRTALSGRALLRDERGDLRAPEQVVREGAAELFGLRRGTWGAGNRYPRLAAALKIAKTAGKREVVAYLFELAEEVSERGGAAVLAEEPELCERLPRCLAIVARAGGAVPDVVPVAAEAHSGEPVLVLAGPALAGSAEVHLFRRWPVELYDAALATRAPLLFALARAGDEAVIDDFLARLEVPDLTAAPAELLPAVRDFR